MIFNQLINPIFGGCIVDECNMPYYKLLFHWLDADNEPAWNFPLKCRGILTTAFYKTKKTLDYCDRFVKRTDFEPCYDFLNLCLVIKDSYLDEINKIIIGLNNIGEQKLGIKSESKLQLTLIGDSCDAEWKEYRLSGGAEWQCSAPIVSYLVYRLREGLEEISPIVFENNFAPYITDDIDLIKKEWSKNYEDILDNESGAHDFGMSCWTDHFLSKTLKTIGFLPYR